MDIEALDGTPDGLGWRTRVRFAVDRAGHVGFHRHRSHDIEAVESCPIAAPAVNRVGSRVDLVERGTSCRGDRFAGRWGAGRVRRHGAQRSGLPPGDRRRPGCRRSSGAGTAADSFRGPRPWIRGQCRGVLAGAPPSRRRPHPVRPRRTRPATGRAGCRPLCRRRSLHRPTGQGRRTGGLGGGRGAEPSGLRRRCAQHQGLRPGRDRPIGCDRRYGLPQAGRTRRRRPRPGTRGCRNVGDAGPGLARPRRHGASPLSRATRPPSPGTSG